jgi:hypothetical protein
MCFDCCCCGRIKNYIDKKIAEVNANIPETYIFQAVLDGQDATPVAPPVFIPLNVVSKDTTGGEVTLDASTGTISINSPGVYQIIPFLAIDNAAVNIQVFINGASAFSTTVYPTFMGGVPLCIEVVNVPTTVQLYLGGSNSLIYSQSISPQAAITIIKLM